MRRFYRNYTPHITAPDTVDTFIEVPTESGGTETWEIYAAIDMSDCEPEIIIKRVKCGENVLDYTDYREFESEIEQAVIKERNQWDEPTTFKAYRDEGQRILANENNILSAFSRRTT
jgi:hypothetical protein